MPEVGSQNTTSAGYFHFLFGNLNPGGNESMTKQRIGVLVVSALLAVASLAQAPPAKQKPAAKKGGGAVSGGPVMPGSEQWMDVPAAALDRVTRGGELGSGAARETEACREKGRGRGERRTGDAGIRAMDGCSCGRSGGDSVGGDGRNAEDSHSAGRPDDSRPFVHS